ncbi:unnamed protein product, partial [Prorocentrum cordatum]
PLWSKLHGTRALRRGSGADVARALPPPAGSCSQAAVELMRLPGIWGPRDLSAPPDDQRSQGPLRVGERWNQRRREVDEQLRRELKLPECLPGPPATARRSPASFGNPPPAPKPRTTRTQPPSTPGLESQESRSRELGGAPQIVSSRARSGARTASGAPRRPTRGRQGSPCPRPRRHPAPRRSARGRGARTPTARAGRGSGAAAR